MRSAILAVCTLCLAAALGCSVLEEIDGAHSAMGIGDEKLEGSTAKAEVPEKRGIDWSVSRSINTGQVDPSIVSCRLAGATQFMRKDDCLTRGGTPSAL
ncbi:MAG: hypothetical protein VX681_00880 [Myxococcota bacterium]|nr:hypothetical protein [Myxococcota bacterium]